MPPAPPAQLEMVYAGKMHGFLRMYWAKKILEWTPSPEEAVAVSIWLNDKWVPDLAVVVAAVAAAIPSPSSLTGSRWRAGTRTPA